MTYNGKQKNPLITFKNADKENERIFCAIRFYPFILFIRALGHF